MNLQQVNFDSLHQRFFQNRRITRIAKFIQEFPADESSAELEDLLRNHAEEPIEDEDELDSRDALDFLLAYYSLLEIASLIGYIPKTLPAEISSPALRILKQPDVKRYYQRHYRRLLPELFRYRLEGRSDLIESPFEDGATAVFTQFVMQAGLLESDNNVSMFLWFLDDGIHNDCDWTDLVGPLKKPKHFFKLVLKPNRSERTLSMGLRGLLTFVQTCRDLNMLLSQAQEYPLLQSAMWHYHNYWFDHLKDKIGSELKGALREFKKWEGFSDKKELYRREITRSLAEVDGALKSLSDGHYGKSLRQAARAIRQGKQPSASAVIRQDVAATTKTPDLISIALRFPDPTTADRIASLVASLKGHELSGTKLLFATATDFHAADPLVHSFAIRLIGGLVGKAGKRLGEAGIKWLIAKIREQLSEGQKVTVEVKGQKIQIDLNTKAESEHAFTQSAIRDTLKSQ